MKNNMFVNTEEMPIEIGELEKRLRFLRKLPISTENDEPLYVHMGLNNADIYPQENHVRYNNLHKIKGAQARSSGWDMVEVVQKERAGKGYSHTYYNFYHSPKKD